MAADSLSDGFKDQLTQVRDLLWRSAHEADATQRASLLKTLVDVLEKLNALPTGEVSKLDELAKRRDTRRAKVQERPAGSDIGG